MFYSFSFGCCFLTLLLEYEELKDKQGLEGGKAVLVREILL